MRIKGTVEKNVETHLLLGTIYERVLNLLHNIEEFNNLVEVCGVGLTPTINCYLEPTRRLREALKYFATEAVGGDE